LHGADPALGLVETGESIEVFPILSLEFWNCKDLHRFEHRKQPSNGCSWLKSAAKAWILAEAPPLVVSLMHRIHPDYDGQLLNPEEPTPTRFNDA
jgi:hypothetical protein